MFDATILPLPTHTPSPNPSPERQAPLVPSTQDAQDAPALSPADLLRALFNGGSPCTGCPEFDTCPDRIP